MAMKPLGTKEAKPLQGRLLGPRRRHESIEGASLPSSGFKFVLSIFLIPLLFPLIFSFTKAAPPAPGSGTLASSYPSELTPEAWAKIEPLVLKQLTEAAEAGPERANGPSGDEVAKDRKITYIVYLKEQADLSPAQRIREKLARRQTVVSSLQAVAEKSQRDIRAYLAQQQASGHVAGYIPFWVFNGLAVTGDLETLLALAARPEVEMIRANHQHQLPNPKPKLQTSNFKLPISNTQHAIRTTQHVEWNIAKVRADQVWKDFGITGRGVVVANMDSGVDWTHPALRGKYRGAAGDHNYNWYDATGTYPYVPLDRKGHGTHTMGIIVGSDPGSNYYIGMAPDAQWMAVKVLDDEGVGYDTWIHAGFQWLLAPTDLNGNNPDPRKAPDVVNNSWGPYPLNVADPAFLPDVHALRAAGILLVFAAGNEGELGDGTVATPASFPESLAVGATDFTDAIASFSSRGPSFWEETKPEVCAPGVDIRSSIPGGGYEGGWSGTSMATPHVAGLAALLWEANPTLTVDDLESFMKYTALDLGELGPDNACGWGRIDAYEAVRWALGAGKLYGQVRRMGEAANQRPALSRLLLGRRSAVSVGLVIALLPPPMPRGRTR